MFQTAFVLPAAFLHLFLHLYLRQFRLLRRQVVAEEVAAAEVVAAAKAWGGSVGGCR